MVDFGETHPCHQVVHSSNNSSLPDHQSACLVVVYGWGVEKVRLGKVWTYYQVKGDTCLVEIP